MVTALPDDDINEMLYHIVQNLDTNGKPRDSSTSCKEVTQEKGEESLKDSNKYSSEDENPPTSQTLHINHI